MSGSEYSQFSTGAVVDLNFFFKKIIYGKDLKNS